MTVAARKKTNALKGILFMVVTCFIVTVSSTIIKTLGNTLNPFEVVMMRCAFTVLITLSFNYHVGPILFKSKQPKLMLIRSILTFVVVTGNFYAISNLPLVEVTSLQFSKPLFLIILAAIFLGEKIRLRRTSATILGFIGILVVLHPWDNATSEGFELAHVAVLGAAFAMAVLAIMSKIMTKTHSTVTLVLYANMATVILCAPFAIYYWTTPDLNQIILIAMLGTTTFCAQYCMISAYKYAEVTIVTPIEYLRIIFAAVAGYLVFNEIPDVWTISGGVIICGSTLFIAYREATQSRKNKN